MKIRQPKNGKLDYHFQLNVDGRPDHAELSADLEAAYNTSEHIRQALIRDLKRRQAAGGDFVDSVAVTIPAISFPNLGN